MITDIILACTSGLDLLTVYLAWQGYSAREIAELTQDSKSGVQRRLQRIRAGVL